MDSFVEGTQNGTYKVYEVGEWTTEHDEETNDNNVVFNYSRDGKEVLDKYVTTRTFIEKYYEDTGNTISSPSEVNNVSGLKLLTKKVYRTKTLVKELK